MTDICHPAIEEFLCSMTDHYRLDRLEKLPQKELLEIMADAMDFDACKRHLASQYPNVNWNDMNDPEFEKAMNDCKRFFHAHVANEDIIDSGGEFIA